MKDFFIFGLKRCGTSISEGDSQVLASVFFSWTAKWASYTKFIKCLFELDIDWILYSLSYSYIKVIYCSIPSTYPDIRAEAIHDSVLLHTFWNTFCGSVELSFEKVKREIFKCSMRCFIQNIQANSHLRSTVCLHSK